MRVRNTPFIKSGYIYKDTLIWKRNTAFMYKYLKHQYKSTDVVCTNKQKTLDFYRNEVLHYI